MFPDHPLQGKHPLHLGPTEFSHSSSQLRAFGQVVDPFGKCVQVGQRAEKASLNMIDEFRQGEALRVRHGQPRLLMQILEIVYTLRQARSVKMMGIDFY